MLLLCDSRFSFLHAFEKNPYLDVPEIFQGQNSKACTLWFALPLIRICQNFCTLFSMIFFFSNNYINAGNILIAENMVNTDTGQSLSLNSEGHLGWLKILLNFCIRLEELR